MKLRDTLNTAAGYQEIIDQNTKYINEDLQDLEESNDKEEINDINKSIFKYTLSSLQAKYSQGRPIQEIRNLLSGTIESGTKVWAQSFGYVGMVWMLSIGIMLEIEDEEFNKLIKLIESDNPKDYLVDALIKYRMPDWKVESNGFKFPKPYRRIKDVFDLSINGDKEYVFQVLKSYLNKYWYKGHSDSGWYDNHKNKFNLHVGYWSYESGAIVKILGLEDSVLKDQQYYPYDLVHWRG